MSCCGTKRSDIFYGSIVQASQCLRTNKIDGLTKGTRCIEIGGCTTCVKINGNLIVTGSNVATALATNIPDTVVVVNLSDPPTLGQVLVATGPDNAHWANPGSGTTGNIAYQLVSLENRTVSTLIPSGYVEMAYFTWNNSLYNTYTNGQLIFEAQITGQTLDIRMKRKSDNTVMTTIPTITVSGTYVGSLINIPTSNDRLVIEIRGNGVGNKAQIFGVTLQFTQ